MTKRQQVTAYITYGGDSGKSKLSALSKLVASGQESASKTATSHIRKTLGCIKMRRRLIPITLILISILGNAQTFNLTDTTFKVGDTLRTYQIVFDLAKWDIIDQSRPFLDSLALFLGTNENVEITIAEHTDLISSKESSIKFSQRRADAIKTYLVNSGIKAERIEAIGFEDDYPINDLKFLDSMSTELEKEKADAANRRTEIIIKTQPNRVDGQ